MQQNDLDGYIDDYLESYDNLDSPEPEPQFNVDEYYDNLEILLNMGYSYDF